MGEACRPNPPKLQDKLAARDWAGAETLANQLTLKGEGYLVNGFMSCSTSKHFSSDWGGSKPNIILFELKLNQDTPGVHVQKGGASSHDNEHEVVLSRRILWKPVGYRQENIFGVTKHVVTVEQQA